MRINSKHGHWHRDYLFYIFASLGLVALMLPAPSHVPPLYVLAVGAFAEELIFRSFTQELIRKYLFNKFQPGLISPSNVLTSILFAAAHLPHQPLEWALATFIPSIVFGIIWDRHHSLTACFLVHFFYNFCFFYS